MLPAHMSSDLAGGKGVTLAACGDDDAHAASAEAKAKKRAARTAGDMVTLILPSRAGACERLARVTGAERR
jgi:hypothetical protein